MIIGSLIIISAGATYKPTCWGLSLHHYYFYDMKERIEILEKKVQVIQEVLEETLKMLNGMNFVVRDETTRQLLRREASNALKKRVENDPLFKSIEKSIKEAASQGKFFVQIEVDECNDKLLDYLNNTLNLEAYISFSPLKNILNIEWD